MDLSMIFNIIFAVFLGVGLIVGFKRGAKRTILRGAIILIIVIALIFVSTKVTNTLLNAKFLSFTYNGQVCTSGKEFLTVMLTDMLPMDGADYSGVVEVGMFLLSIILNGLIFIVLYWMLKIITIPVYWILKGFIFAKERKMKRRAKKEKQKNPVKKYRLAGALIGCFIALISFCVTFTPIVGYINVVQLVEKTTTNAEGKGVISQSAGDTYTQYLNQYNNSIPIKVTQAIGLDKVMLSIFDGLTSSTINNTKVTLSEEAVAISNIYNELVEVGDFDINTITQEEMADLLDDANSIINTTFESKLLSSSIDNIMPFATQYVRQTIDTTNFKPYVLNFYNSLMDEVEGLKSATAKHELVNIVGLVESLNDSNLLLPIVQESDNLDITYIQTFLTKESSDAIIGALFSVNTINNLAPALVNFLLGVGAEQLGYEYTPETEITSNVLKNSIETMMSSVVDLLGAYNEELDTKVEINETTVSALGGMLDEFKNILTLENFKSIVDSLEPKLIEIASDALKDQPQFLQDTAEEAIENISEISSFKTALLDVYGAFKEVETQFNDAKVDDDYDVQYMDFTKLGKALDKVQNSGLFGDNLLLRTMSSAIEYFSEEFEKTLSTEDEPFTFTFDEQLVSNIDDVIENGITWESELPKYKNTFGVFINLFQNEGEIIDKIKSDADTTLEELGVELDTNLHNSLLLKDVDRLLVADLLSFADLTIGAEDENISTLLSDAKANILTVEDIEWSNELLHIKELLKIDFESTDDSAIIGIAQSIDKIVFGYEGDSSDIPGSVIFTSDIIKNFISNYMDNVFSDISTTDDFYDTITQIKTSINTEEITSFETEITALLTLKDVKEIVEADDFDFTDGTPAGAVLLGQKLDEAIAVGGVVVDKQLVNGFIVKKLDGYFTSYSDMEQELAVIKAGFTDSIEKYEAEFTALLNLMKVSDHANATDFDFMNQEHAMTLGASIDTALSKVTIDTVDYQSKIVTYNLVNGYIKRYISDTSNINIDSEGKFGDFLQTITGTKVDTTFSFGRLDQMEEYDLVDNISNNIYQREFVYLSKLLVVCEAFEDITLETINDINPTLNTTLTDQYDGNIEENDRDKVLDPIRNSYLVGDSLLVAIDGVLEVYVTDNSAEYGDILDEVTYNYEEIARCQVYWAGNTTGGIPYTYLIGEFVELNDILNSSLTDEIDDITQFTNEIAQEYDTTLMELQGTEKEIGNILFLSNGTNRIAKYALNKIREKLTDETVFATAINYIDTYMAFLDGTLYQGDLVKEIALPYSDTTTMYYTYKVDGEWAVLESPTADTIQVNTPFEYISSLLVSE